MSIIEGLKLKTTSYSREPQTTKIVKIERDIKSQRFDDYTM